MYHRNRSWKKNWTSRRSGYHCMWEGISLNKIFTCCWEVMENTYCISHTGLKHTNDKLCITRFLCFSKKLPVSIVKRWFIQGTSLKIRWHPWSHPPLQTSFPLSHQQMLLVPQQIKLSLNVTGDISHAAASLCSNWFFFFHLLALKGIRAQALLQLPRNCS